MAHIDPRLGLTPTILDRLIDPESGGTSWQRGYSFEEMLSAIRRDLEELLNAQLPLVLVPEEFPELARSVACFGVPEFAALGSNTARPGPEVALAIRQAIERFEPRLRDVRVTPVEWVDRKGYPELRFQITGAFRMTPSPNVSFVTELQLATGHTLVRLDE